MSRIVTLTTDFGTRDSYVAEMKGRLLSIAGDILPVDVTHEVPAHDARAGANILRKVMNEFPKGTIHLVIVDPGVGSPRRALAVESGGMYYLGPDNGVLTPALARAATIISIDDRWRRPSPGRTFDGRDLFVPVAERIHAGVELSSLGAAIHDAIMIDPSRLLETPAGIEGVIESIDHFGNVITNIPAERTGSGGEIAIGSGPKISFCRNYSEIPPGEVRVLASSDGSIEIAANRRSAAELLGCSVGDPVAYLRRLKSSNNS